MWCVNCVVFSVLCVVWHILPRCEAVSGQGAIEISGQRAVDVPG